MATGDRNETRLIGPSSLSATDAGLGAAVVASNFNWVIKQIILCNTSGTDRLVYLGVGGAATGGTSSSICRTGNSVLSLNPSAGYASSSITWQESPDSTTLVYATITGANTATYSTPSNTVNKKYRAIVTNGTTTCFQTSDFTLSYVNPIVRIDTTNNPRCGNGFVTMKAVATTSGANYVYQFNGDGSIRF